MTNPKDPQAELRKQLEQIMMLAKIGYDTGSNWQHDTIQSIEALFQAHQRELLSELLGGLPEKAETRTHIPIKTLDEIPAYNAVIDQVVSVIKSKIGELNG